MPQPGQSSGTRGTIPVQRGPAPTGRDPEHGRPRGSVSPPGVYGSSRPADHDEPLAAEYWTGEEPDSGGWSADDSGYGGRRWTGEEPDAGGLNADDSGYGGRRWIDEDPDAGGLNADDPGYGGRRWTDDEPDSGGWSADDPGYSERRWTDEEPTPYRRDDEATPRRAAVYGAAAPADPGRPHKRRADVTAVDLGYTGRRTKPDPGPAVDPVSPDPGYGVRGARPAPPVDPVSPDAGYGVRGGRPAPAMDSAPPDISYGSRGARPGSAADSAPPDGVYGSRGTKPDSSPPKNGYGSRARAEADDLDDDGAYWRRIASDPDDW